MINFIVLRKNYILTLILVSAVVFRFLLSQLTFHKDLIIQAGWGEFIAQTGTSNFYTHNVWTFSWPNHPPLTSLYYGYCYKLYLQNSLRLHQSILVLNKIGFNGGSYYQFVDSFDKLVSPEVPYQLGFLISLKIIPIIFDVLIGLLIFLLANREKKKPYKYLLLYLMLPFSWYISALWGQTDQMSSLFAIVSFLLLTRSPIISIILFFLSVSIKPTSLFLAPLFLFVLIKNKTDLKKIITGGVICLVLNFFIFKMFTNVNIVEFTFKTLIPRMFDRPPRLTTNSYNFWHLITLDKPISDKISFFYIPASIWTAIFYFSINLISFRFLKKIDKKSLLVSIFVVSFGSWLFLTNMLDRYSFTGIVTGLMISIYFPEILKYWIILSSIYWLNLFKGWWYPESFSGIRYLLTMNGSIAGFFLSLVNVLVYLKILLILSGKKFLTRPKNGGN